eukprot:TRINITY_DN68178_c13_g6_i2.p2 TRINITY_DN68178_c13_g6~~TRINITY_DN68178_c13_g6_i2.p2  ORF type:complete len:310 (-),score=164.43 TRINITY_DN68178_c13_g6_i2:71-1000(-)
MSLLTSTVSDITDANDASADASTALSPSGPDARRRLSTIDESKEARGDGSAVVAAGHGGGSGGTGGSGDADGDSGVIDLNEDLFSVDDAQATKLFGDDAQANNADGEAGGDGDADDAEPEPEPAVPAPVEVVRAYLFHVLWDTILLRRYDAFLDPQRLSAYARLMSRGGGGPTGVACIDCAESTRHLRLKQARVMQRIEAYLHKYVVFQVSEDGSHERDRVEFDMSSDLELATRSSSQSSSSSSPSTQVVHTVRMLIYVPPSSHMLMKWRVGPTSTLVRIRTDNYTLMQHVDQFFDEVFVADVPADVNQ